MCVSAPSHRASIYVYCIPSTLAAVDGETYSPPLSLFPIFAGVRDGGHFESEP